MSLDPNGVARLCQTTETARRGQGEEGAGRGRGAACGKRKRARMREERTLGILA